MTPTPLQAAPTDPLVIKIGGSTLEDVDRLAPLWKAIASLSRREQILIVHGGGKAVDALLLRLDLPVDRRHGLRVTPDNQIDLITGVLAGSVNKSLVGAINREGGRAVGICLGDGGSTNSSVLSHAGQVQGLGELPPGQAIDLGRVGVLHGGNGELFRLLLNAGFLPIVASIALECGTGRPLNVNADDAAASLAAMLRARSLVLMTDVPGIKRRDGTVCDRLTVAELEAMIASGEITGGMVVKARAVAAASAASPVVILSGESDEPLMKFLAGDPVGTTVVRS